jgi:tetratricopeptide (TPR) repeat protein
MSDDGKALNMMIAAIATAAAGDLNRANELYDEVLGLDVEPQDKVRARRSKSLNLFQLGELQKAVEEAEFALELDRTEKTAEFVEKDDRGVFFAEVDCAWFERLKQFGREGQWDAGIRFGEDKLRLLEHIDGTYMPLTQLWIGRKLAARGEHERAVSRLKAGLAAEVPDINDYLQMVEDAASSARTALEMYNEYGVLSPQEAFEAGTNAVEAGEHDRAIRAYEGVLALGVAPILTAHTHVRLSFLYFKQQQKVKAAEHGEKALGIAGTLDSEILSELDIGLRDLLFARLEGAWTQAAERIEASDGIPEARDYLLERLKLIRSFPDDYFPVLRLKIGKYSVEMGDAETARENLINAVASQFPDSDDPKLKIMYQHIREEAAEWVLRAARMRNTSQSPQSSEQKSSVTGENKCWVATAACGPQSIEVLILRRFRDRNCANGWKSAAIHAYYRTAPALARLVAKHPALQRSVRFLIVAPAARYALRSLTSKRSM